MTTLQQDTTRSYQIENDTLKQLLILEKEFQEHNALMKKEILIQEGLVARLLVVSQRYIILQSKGPCCRYPEIYTGPAEDVLLHEFTEKLKEIRNSNCRINDSLSEIRKSCLALDDLCAEVDMTIESPLVTGDAFHKPISYLVELVNDIVKYFHAWILKLIYCSHRFDPLKIESIEHYKQQIAVSEDFEEYLNMGLTYCKCAGKNLITHLVQ